MASALFKEPTRSVPVTAKVGFEFGDHDEVALADLDRAVTSWTDVPLAGCVRLDRGDDLYPERIAHSSNTTTTSTVPTTKRTSVTDFCWVRNGLKPMGAW